MTYVEEQEFLGWTAARKGEPFNPHAEPAWQEGYRFRMSTAQEVECIKTFQRIDDRQQFWQSQPRCPNCVNGITDEDDICDVCHGEGRVLQ